CAARNRGSEAEQADEAPPFGIDGVENELQLRPPCGDRGKPRAEQITRGEKRRHGAEGGSGEGDGKRRKTEDQSAGDAERRPWDERKSGDRKHNSQQKEAGVPTQISIQDRREECFDHDHPGRLLLRAALIRHPCRMFTCRAACSLVKQPTLHRPHGRLFDLEAQRVAPSCLVLLRRCAPKRERSAETALGADRRTLACLRGTRRDACEACPRPLGEGRSPLGAPLRPLRVVTASGRWVARGRRARPGAGAAPASAYGMPPETPSGEAGSAWKKNKKEPPSRHPP